MKYVMYGSPQCFYCNAAKDLFEHKGIDYEYINIAEKEEDKQFLLGLGLRTVPQVFLFDVDKKEVNRVGGYEDLVKHFK